MEHDDGALGDVLDVLHGAAEVHSAGIGVIVPISININLGTWN